MARLLYNNLQEYMDSFLLKYILKLNNKFMWRILFLFFTITLSAQSSTNTCLLSIKDYGAKLDGTTDDSKAIMSSLADLGYAFIPNDNEGAVIKKTIILSNGQKIFGSSRASKIISRVNPGNAAIKINDIPFSGDALINDLTLDIKTNSIGIHIVESRNVFVENIFINGNNKCTQGVIIDGGLEKGSAWNQMIKYTILRCDVGLEISSRTKRNWSNRNYIGFGIIQSCKVAVKLDRANTNKIEANPQGSGVAFQLINSHHNRFESFTENSSSFDIEIDSICRQNTFVGEFSPSKISDKGKDNNFSLSKKRTKMYYDRVNDNK